MEAEAEMMLTSPQPRPQSVDCGSVENPSPIVLVEQMHWSRNRKPVNALSCDVSHKRALTQRQSAAMTPATVKNILSGTARSEVTALFAPFLRFKHPGNGGQAAEAIFARPHVQTHTSKISFSRPFWDKVAAAVATGRQEVEERVPNLLTTTMVIKNNFSDALQ